MDDTYVVPLTEAVHAARVFWPQEEGRPRTVLARPVSVNTVRGRVPGWAFTPDLTPPSQPQAGDSRDLLVFDDLYADVPPRPLDLTEIYGTCTSLFRLSSGCPCVNGEGRARFEEEGTYAERQDATSCGADLVWPRLKPQLPAGRQVFIDHGTDTLPARYPKKILEFQRLTAGDILGKTIPRDIPTLDDLEIDTATIEHFAEIRSKASKDAAYTRRFKEEHCKACVFKSTCPSWGIHRCDGAASEEQVRLANDRRGAPWKEPEGFTSQQVDWLMVYASTHHTYEAVKGTFCHNRRVRNVNLGFFDDCGRFLLFAANGKSDDSEHYSSWEELVRTLPELHTWAEKYPDLPPVSAEAKRLYAHVRTRKYIQRRGMHGYYSHELRCISASRYGVDYAYGRYGQWRRYLRAGGDEVALYNLLHDSDTVGWQMYRENG